MPKTIAFDVPPIEEDLEWIDETGKVSIDILVAQGGITDGAQIKSVKDDLRRSQALALIKTIIAKRYQASQTKINNISDPSWPLQVAYLEGYRKALREIYQTIPVKTRNIE